ncbi:conserved exported hypothetical protein [Paraburkholderia ribeironis]|uniref:Uncharacterized protein n=1 Tax=Paraburkholderia ribeironis TaxID=1247936 RepID=A0A1N7S6F1_9BURK|nr:hypothetical protein [Paraburkholderia ribeironis]SIT42899.1 conserved exported hypothetical protein [Paraburkholderia ribeironis]
MELRTYTVLTLMVFSTAAFAWQPLTYPIQSQSPYRRGVDTALCFAEASHKTKVDIRREPQIPPRTPPASKSSSTGVPSRPPLPSSTFSAAPMSASMPSAATAPGASAPVATAATAAAPAKTASEATTGSATTATTAASATSADLGASNPQAAGSLEANAASGVKLPPLPAPEPPMTRYWAAYGACMQARGYVVVQ